jgi:hypothetical protein
LRAADHPPGLQVQAVGHAHRAGAVETRRVGEFAQFDCQALQQPGFAALVEPLRGTARTCALELQSLTGDPQPARSASGLRPFLPGPCWVTVAAFGLVHGFGLAGPLQDLGLHGGDLALPLRGFNLGVEAGRLAVVTLLLPLTLALRASAGYQRRIVRPGPAAVALL